MSDAVEITIKGNPSGAIDAFVKVKESARDFSREIGQVSQDVARELLQVAGVTLSVKAALDAVGEGFKKGDEVRDLEMSLGVFSGSAEKGRQVMTYFESQMSSTRNTAHELAQTFRDEVPLAVARGFSRESMQQITVWLSQFATVSHQSLESVESGFQNLLAGVIRNPAKNPILAFLGVTKADVANLGWDDVIGKIAEVASHADEFGQSFESTMHKVHEAWFVAFGEGVNGALDGNRQALTNLKDALTDPAFLGALHDLGGEFAQLVIGMRDIVAGYREVKGMQSGANTPTFEQDHPAWTWLADHKESFLLYDALHASPPRAQNLTDRTKDIMYGSFEGTFNPRANDLRNPSPGDWFNTNWDQPRSVPSLVGPTPTFGPPTPSVEQQLQSQLGISTITGYGGDIHAFYARVESDLEAHKGKTKEIIESVKDEIHGSMIAWSDYSSSVQYAIKPTDDLTEAAKKNAAALGLVKENTKAAQAAQAAEESIGKVTTRYEAESIAIQGRIDLMRTMSPTEKALVELHVALADAAAKSTSEHQKSAVALGLVSAATRESNLQAQVALEIKRDTLAVMSNIHSSIANSFNMQMPFTMTELGGASWDPFNMWRRPQIDPITGRPAIEAATFNATGYRQISSDAQAQIDSVLALEKTFKNAIADGERRFVQQFSSDFSSIVQSGGQDFVQIIAQGFGSTVDDAVKQLTAKLFGSSGDNTKAAYDVKGNYVGVQDSNKLYDSAGHDISGRATAGRAALDVAQVAAAGYGAGYSGTPGARTSAELSGALALAALGGSAAGTAMLGAALGTSITPVIGTVIGAVAGLAIGAVMGMIGAQQRQSEYKFGVPSVDSSGVAHFAANDNYTAEAAKNVTRQIQTVYDAIHDSLAMVLIKAGALVPLTRGFTDSIQSRASGHFEEHLALYLQGTLPTELIGQFKDDLAALAGNFGMSADRFKSIFDALGNLDPSKAVTLFASLFDSLQGLSAALPGRPENAYDVTHWTNAMVGFNPFAEMYHNIEYQAQLNPGQIVKQQDKGILDLAGAWQSLSPEGQINALAQVNTLVQQRYQTEIQLAQQLYSLVKQIDASSDAASKNYAAMAILKDDGSPDQYGLAQFYKKAADADLREGQLAKNADQLAAAYQKYQADVQAAVAAGYGNDPTKAGKQAWAQYGLDSTATGKAFFDSLAVALGGSINLEQEQFNKQFDPIIEAFKAGVAKMFPDQKVDPTTGKPYIPNPDDDPLVRANVKLTNSADAFSTALSGTVAPVQTFIGIITAMSAALLNLQNAVGNSDAGAEELAQALAHISRDRNVA